MELKIGQTIKSLRKQQGRTQENLAEALGLTFQAVSRWESGAVYPDIALIPSIANYFGVSIDELFGCGQERQKKVDALISKIQELDRANNGEDVCIEACIRLARAGLVEFPGNEDLLICLAGLLYNAGYARHGEYHLTNADGYDIFDVERHRSYAEWNEAKTIYEKLVSQLPDGPRRQEVVLRLTQLRAATGETEKALALIASLPDVSGSRDLLILNALDGKPRAEACDQALAKLLLVCANLLCSPAALARVPNREAIRRVQNSISLLKMNPTEPALPDDKLTYHGITGIWLYLSVFLWREGDRDGAFAALDEAYAAAKPRGQTAELPSYWPCWRIPGYEDVEAEMKSDGRWAAWAAKCSQ